MAELLKLLQILCVSPNKLPSSVYQLKEMFNCITSTRYYHCKICTLCRECTDNCHCDKPSVGIVITVSIDKALKTVVTSKSCNFCMIFS